MAIPKVHSWPFIRLTIREILMDKNILISGATMILPNETKLGDLRITDGIISEIGDAGALENNENEAYVDGTGLHLLPE